MHERDVLHAIEQKQQDEYTLSADLTPELLEKWVRELMAACKKRGTGSWQASTIARCLEMLERIQAAKKAAAKAEAQPQAIGVTFVEAAQKYADLGSKIAELESQLGLKPQPPPATTTEPAPKPVPQPTPQPPEPVAAAIPAVTGQSHCDRHGPYTAPKWNPACPTCKGEWEAQTKNYERYLGSLLPGEPGWGR
jgi:hypothetical protein